MNSTFSKNTESISEELLRKSEQYQNLFKHANDAILIIEPENETVLNANVKACEIYGFEFADFIGLSLKSISKDIEFGDGQRQNLLEVGTCQEFETVQFRRDGTPINFQVNAAVIEYKGRPAILSINRDITERIRTEQALQEREQHLWSVANAAQDGIVSADNHGRINFWNEGARKIFGYDAEEVNGKSLAILMPERYREVHAKGMRRYVETGEKRVIGKAVELHGLRKDGSEFPLELSLGDWETANGKYFTGIMRDITERKRAEEKLREGEQRLRGILDASRDGIVIEDDSQITYTNDSYAKLLGYDQPEDLVGKNIKEFLPPDEAKRLSEFGRRRLRGEEVPSVYEFKGRRRDGTSVELEGAVSTSVIGDKKFIMTAIRDITGCKRAEAALLKETAFSELLRMVAVAANEAANIEDAAQFCLDQVCDLTGWRLGHLNLLDSSGDLASTSLWHVRDRERFEKFIGETEKIQWSKGIGLSGRVLETGRAVWIVDVADTRHFIRTERAAKVGIISAFAFPILVQGKVSGVLEFFSTVREESDEKLLEVMVSIGNQLGQVIERKRAEEALRESEYRLRTLLTSMSEGLLQVDREDCIVFVNNYFCELIGYPEDELVGENWSRLLLGDEGNDFIRQVNKRRRKGISDRYELSLKKKSGETLFVMVSGVPILDADNVITGSMGVFTDITERKRIEEQLQHDAFHDGLTGLANRALFMNHLQMTIERGKSRRSNSYAVLFLDFDRFKMINDSLGHAEGDKLLQFIARRLESATRTGDLVARFGGDEFIVLLSELAEENDAVEIVERMQAGFKKSFDLSGNEIFITASIGIALSITGHKRAEDMVRDADIAMYRAKAKGKAQYQIFDRAMLEHASKQLRLETEMRRALKMNEFLVHYQPLINLETGGLLGFEALVRWAHPTRGMISPIEFIPAAEENGLILPLGNWVLRESCRQLREWQTANPAAENLTVSVNLSCKQFIQPDLAEQIARKLKETGLDPRCLKLEITESHIMENTETAVAMMNKLRLLGVELSLDDFGTGYSSLSHLHRLPVSYLKIDRSFITRMIESEENSEIVQTIIRLAQNLKMKVVAEGIETSEQLAHLKNLNCEYGQGYFFSKPLSAEAAEMFFEKRMESPMFVTDAPIINHELNM